MIRVLLCDDHEIVRDALGRVVDAAGDMEVVANVGSCAELVALPDSCTPDVAVVDVRLGDCTGQDALSVLRTRHPRCHVIFLTSFQSDRALLDAYELGAKAFLLKSTSIDELLDSIRDVAAGVRGFDVSEVRSAAERLAGDGHIEFMETDDVGRQILVLLARGLSDQDIAEAVGLNVQTVRNRVSRLLQSFGKHNRTQLALTIDRLLRYDGDLEIGDVGTADPRRSDPEKDAPG